MGLLTVLAKKLVSHDRVLLAINMLCASFFAATIATVFVMPGALPLLVLVPILAMTIALPYFSSRALRGLTIAAWLVTILVVVLAQIVTPIEPPTVLAINAVVVVGIIAMGPILMLLLWQSTTSSPKRWRTPWPPTPRSRPPWPRPEPPAP